METAGTQERSYYNFSDHILWDQVREGFLDVYLDDEDFLVIATHVLERNHYIEPGNRPTGLRDLEFSYEVFMNHVKNAADQGVIFRRGELQDKFDVLLNQRQPEIQ